MSDAAARAMTKTNDTAQNDIKFCSAKTRSGMPCQKHPIAGRTRCRLHGGRSTGPRTPEGKAACVAAHWKHGRRSKAFVEARKQIWAELRRVERSMRAQNCLLPAKPAQRLRVDTTGLTIWSSDLTTWSYEVYS